MSALIDGYEYDIFISYRQNDNKHDGWVTEFVSNLKKELEATVKERLTVYFDENPLDGLLDTHSVDKSLSEKLKCLIFIPIISQTYCDTESFAWKNEFCVFNRNAAGDQLGRSIRLSNGNVASRILAVRIHDLDPEDRRVIENETGEKLRSIDFIYRSPGVNRPLRAHEDYPGANLNKTYYRDQINKVANSIKDITTVLRRKDPQINTADLRQPLNERRKIFKFNKTKTVIFTILLLAGSAAYILSRVPDTGLNAEKSIAVLPFLNNSPNDSNAYFINGIMEEVLSNLQKIKDIRIISRTSVEKYRNSSKTIPQIAKELGVNYIVEGSGQRYGNSFRLNVQLIRAKKETYLWGDLYEQNISLPEDIIKVQSSIAQSIVSELEGTITPLEKQIIEKIPTANLTAYDFYQKGREELSRFWMDASNRKALSGASILFRKSLEYDPHFAEAIIGQAEVLWYSRDNAVRKKVIDSIYMLTDIAISYDDRLADAYVIKGWCNDDEGLSDKALRNYKKAIDLNPNDWKAYFGLAELYDFEDPVKSLTNLQKAASLTHGAMEMPALLRHMGGELLITGFYEKAREYFSRAFELDGDSAILMSCLGGIEHNQGNYDKAIEYYKKALRIKSNYSEVMHDLALYTQLTGRQSESLKYYRGLESAGPITFNMHRAAYTLWTNGFRSEADNYFDSQIDYCNSVLRNGRRSDLKYYSYYDLAGIYAFRGDRKKAYENLRSFSESRNFFTYMITLMKNDPLMKNIKNEPEFNSILDEMEKKFNRVHEEVREWLGKNPMI